MTFASTIISYGQLCTGFGQLWTHPLPICRHPSVYMYQQEQITTLTTLHFTEIMGSIVCIVHYTYVLQLARVATTTSSQLRVYMCKHVLASSQRCGAPNVSIYFFKISSSQVRSSSKIPKIKNPEINCSTVFDSIGKFRNHQPPRPQHQHQSPFNNQNSYVVSYYVRVGSI